MTNQTPVLSVRRLSGAVLYLVLFFSGVSALIYQVVWIRKFGLVFGVHVFSMTTVLTAFMAGLALGALFFGRLADRKKNPVMVFLFLELGIGSFALLFPFTFHGLEGLYRSIALTFSPGQYTLQLIRFAISFLFLMIPTSLMGGTMPVIIRIFVHNLGEIGGKVSRLYAVNNMGAVAGGFLAGFVTIRAIGLYESAYMAAAMNCLNALLVLWVVFRSRRLTGSMVVVAKAEASLQLPEKDDFMLSGRLLRLVFWTFAIEGFTTLAYELLWMRILVDFSMDKTTYFSTVIIISFIFGLGFGSFLVNRIIDRQRNLFTWLAAIQVLIGLVSVFLILVFTWVAPKLAVTRSMFGTWTHEAGREYLFFFLLLLPPSILMGITYPLVSKLANDSMDRLGRRMGILGFIDTIGSVIGSFTAGFILIPFIGVLRSFVLIVLINVVLGTVLFMIHPRLSKWKKGLFVSASLIAACILFYYMPRSTNVRSWWEKPGNHPWFDPNHYTAIRFFDEGAAGTVTVREYPDGLALNINGHNTAYATPKDLKVNRQLGYLPYLLHPHPKRALVIGYGMGATVCSLNQPDMEQVDVAEICSGVIRASSVFNAWNRDAIHQPKVRLYDDDGRSVVYMATKKYDIITSNAIHPRLSNNIYTRDFYTLCREKLTDDGILCQWTPENWLTEEEYRSLVKAFVDVFPHATMWYVNEYSTLLVGTKKPLKVDMEKLTERFRSNGMLQQDFAAFGMTSPYEFIGQYWMSEKDLAAYVRGSRVNTDNYPLVEFSRVIHIGPVPDVMEDLIRHEVRVDEILVNMGKLMDKEYELQAIRTYAQSEKYRMQSIANVTRAYMKHVGR